MGDLSDNSKKIDNSEKNISTTHRATRTIRRKIFRLLCLQHRRLRHQLRLVTLGGSSSRTRENYRQRSEARHQLAPECGKSPSRPAISSTSATQRSQQRSGARQQLASNRDCDFTTTTRLRHCRLRRAVHTAPDKS
jgi:hypothetical protein